MYNCLKSKAFLEMSVCFHLKRMGRPLRSHTENIFIVCDVVTVDCKMLFRTIHETSEEIHAATKDISSLINDEAALLMVICERQVPMKWRQIRLGPRSIVGHELLCD